MSESYRAEPMLIVTGSSLRAEEADRPLAYYLKQRMEKQLRGIDSEGARLQVFVVADVRWLHEEELQSQPTIALGGPGVNLLTHRWLEAIPLSLAVEQRFYIQMDPELGEPRASIWGMDNAETQIAVAMFVDRFMPRFLDHCVRNAADFAALDLDDEREIGSDELD